MPPIRALLVIRLSRVTDSTTSPERQLSDCEQLCQLRGYGVAGIAEDLDVSGSVDPFDRKKRPNLAHWLHDRHDEFDVIVAYRVDRFTRSVRHLQQLVNWADDHHKLVVSATEAHFDTTSPFAAVLIALLVGPVAEMELQAISERNRSTAQYNIRAGKYRGSKPPWGCNPPDDSTGEWRLVQDSEQVKIILEVRDRVLSGEPLQRIGNDLTVRGIPTPKDAFAVSQKRPPEGLAWNMTTLKRSLRSEAMLGHVTTADGKAVRGDRRLARGSCDPDPVAGGVRPVAGRARPQGEARPTHQADDEPVTPGGLLRAPRMRDARLPVFGRLQRRRRTLPMQLDAPFDHRPADSELPQSDLRGLRGRPPSRGCHLGDARRIRATRNESGMPARTTRPSWSR